MEAMILQHAPKVLAIGAGLAGVAVLGMSAISVVPAGHVGIVDTFGKVRDTTLAPGFHGE